MAGVLGYRGALAVQVRVAFARNSAMAEESPRLPAQGAATLLANPFGVSKSPNVELILFSCFWFGGIQIHWPETGSSTTSSLG
jgi:hypothetical protein